MQQRERHCISETLAIHFRSNKNFLQLNIGKLACGRDYHCALTGGETVLLASGLDMDDSDSLLAQGDIIFDSQSGVAIRTTAVDMTDEPDAYNFCQKSARGGLVTSATAT